LIVNVSSLASYDSFTVTQAASLAGTLTVNRLGGYTPASSDSFTVLTASSVSGTFDTENLGGFNINYNPNNVELVWP